MKFDRTGGRFVTVLRVFFEVFCAVLLIMSLVGFCFSINYFFEYRNVFNHVPEIVQGEVNANWAMFPVYFFVFFSLAILLTSLFGLFGAIFKKALDLSIYIGLMSALLLASALFFTLAATFQPIKDTTKKILKSYTDYTYGFSEMKVSGFFDKIIDGLQQYHHCCGFFEKIVTNSSDGVYVVILYWSETTNWGQIQWEQVGFEDSARGPFVPSSCCIDEGAKESNFGIFQERLIWNEHKEETWKRKIFSGSCSKEVFGLAELSGLRAGVVIFLLVFFHVFLAVTVVIAFGLRKTLVSWQNKYPPRTRKKEKKTIDSSTDLDCINEEKSDQEESTDSTQQSCPSAESFQTKDTIETMLLGAEPMKQPPESEKSKNEHAASPNREENKDHFNNSSISGSSRCY